MFLTNLDWFGTVIMDTVWAHYDQGRRIIYLSSHMFKISLEAEVHNILNSNSFR